MLKKITHNKKYILKNHTPRYITYYLIIVVVIISLFLIMFFKFEYNKNYKYQGIVKKVDNYKLYIYAKGDVVSSLSKGQLFIDKKNYDYEINSISEDYYLIDNNNYYLMELNIELEDRYLIDNNLLDVNIKLDETTMWQEFKKGF